MDTRTIDGANFPSPDGETVALSAMWSALRERCGDNAKRLAVVDDWHASVKGAKPKGTMRQWFSDHDGMSVDTFQYSATRNNVWMPTDREIACHATYVDLGGSRRDFAGLKVRAVTDDALVVADFYHVIIYRVR